MFGKEARSACCGLFFVRVRGSLPGCLVQLEKLFGVSGCLAWLLKTHNNCSAPQRQGELPSLAAWEEDTNNCSKCPQGGVPGVESQAEKKVKRVVDCVNEVSYYIYVRAGGFLFSFVVVTSPAHFVKTK